MRMVNPIIEIRAGDWKSALEMRIVRFLYGALAALIFYDLRYSQIVEWLSG